MCIVQDDLEDWARESKLMASIYGSSYINLAATSAVDGNVGLFFDRDSSHVWRHRVQVRATGVERQYDCVEDGIYEACMFRSPLAERAWVIQERLLAPRALHFSSTQLFWECNSLNACEVFPHKLPSFLKERDFYLNKQPVSRARWGKIAQFFSICKLTYSKDKLIAIVGLAQEIYNQNHQNEYYAELWRRDMEVQLCWKARSPTTRPVPPRAPTWSWASVDGTSATQLHLKEISMSKFVRCAYGLTTHLEKFLERDCDSTAIFSSVVRFGRERNS